MVFGAEDEIRWILTSSDKDQKSSNATSANSNSTKCTGNLKSAAVSTELEEDKLLDMEKLTAYPNPVDDKLYLRMENIETYRRIDLYDFAGRSIPIESMGQRADRVEIEMGHLPPGPYYIRLEMEDEVRVVSLIKE